MRRRVERQLARARRWHWLTIGVLVCLVAAASAQAGTGDTPAAAPLQQFVAPAAGSYRLERIQQVPAGSVLDERGRALPLADVTTGKITLLGFIYTYCVDPIGCPLAFRSFSTVREKVAADPALARRVRLVSMSFDPSNDTPEAMRRYAGKLADEGNAPRWHFLTSRSVDELKPIIDAFGQDVAVQRDEKGRATRLIHHMLKVFLIDPQGLVREIYSTAYLMPEVMVNDIRTLAMEREGREGRQLR